MVQYLPLIASVSIDVDVTTVMMGAIFLLLLGILQPLIVGPYLKVRDLRDDATDGAREEAGEFEERAEARFQEYEEKMTEARREAVEIRESLKAQGTTQTDEMLAETRHELSEKLAEERAKIQGQVDIARAQLEERAEALSTSIVQKVLPGA